MGDIHCGGKKVRATRSVASAFSPNTMNGVLVGAVVDYGSPQK